MQIFNKIKAWGKVLSQTTTDEDKRRAKICEQCPMRKYNKYLDFVNDELKEVKGFVCSDCGCPLVAKIRSEDKNDICYKWRQPTS